MDAIEIKLYALIGNPSSRTKRMLEKIIGQWAIILIDLIDIGSTCNFLDSSILEALRLLVTSKKGFEVRLANRDVITTRVLVFMFKS